MKTNIQKSDSECSAFLGLFEGDGKERREDRRERRQDRREERRDNREPGTRGAFWTGLGGFFGELLGSANNNSYSNSNPNYSANIIPDEKDYTLLIAGSAGVIILVVVLVFAFKR